MQLNEHGRTPAQQEAYDKDQKRREGVSRLHRELAARQPHNQPAAPKTTNTVGGLTGVIRQSK